MSSSPGFDREEIAPRYDISRIDEDEWHAFGDLGRARLIKQSFGQCPGDGRWLLNAGAGVHQLDLSDWVEISLDLFPRPIAKQKFAVCGSITDLPFNAATIAGIVCTGEVLGYCDPARAIREFSRVLAPGGMLVCDFGNTRSARFWFTSTYGRAADMVTVDYNGSPERIWIYDRSYITSLLQNHGFVAKRITGIYGWGTLVQRFGAKVALALKSEHALTALPFPTRWADVTAVVAQKI